MSTYIPARRALKPPPSRNWRWVWLLATLMAGAVGATFALFGAAILVPGGTLTAGGLSIARGALTWSCPDQGASGDDTTLPGFLLAPGQTMILRQAITTTTVGDNMRVALTVGLPGMSQGASATWHLETGGKRAAPTKGDVPLTDALVLPDLSTSDWVVVVTLVLPAGDPEWVDPATVPSPAPQALSLGTLTVTVSQIRCGDGFTVACPSPGANDE